MYTVRETCWRSKIHDTSGLTLVELLVTTAILGIVVVSLHQVMSTSLSAYLDTTSKQDLLAEARYAMERMVLFVQEADEIKVPAAEKLEVPERVLDTYDNTTQTYVLAGDGFLDADFDADGLVDEGGGDTQELVKFHLNKTAEQLIEKMPDRRSGEEGSYLADKVLCEHVTLFKCKKLTSKLVEIELGLRDGRSEVSLRTRVKARLAP
jgi:prepilin-type N-terminal cleavage/methylation domain-containing protein